MHEQAPLKSPPEPGKMVILLHGRGGNASEMLGFAAELLPRANYIALQADDNAWYPYPFMQPRERNEPQLSAALDAIQRTITQSGKTTEDIILFGFSQGACLAAEFAARYPARYGGLVLCSGGLIGEQIQPPSSSLDGTPVVVGCSMQDPHIPLTRVNETIAALQHAGAAVTTHIYEGASHTITQAELELASSLIQGN